jgi:hypothetical protein
MKYFFDLWQIYTNSTISYSLEAKINLLYFFFEYSSLLKFYLGLKVLIETI